MSETLSCPYCGSRPSEAEQVRDSADGRGVSSLASELQRIREIVEAREARADKQRIEELSREVMQLRETVARLRGSATAVHGYR